MATKTPEPAAQETAPVVPERPAQMAEVAPRRTVTVPALPLAIIGAVVAALAFFGGGVALGVAIGHPSHRVADVRPFGGQHGPGMPGMPGMQGDQGGQQDGRQGGMPNGGQNGFGQNGGQSRFGQNDQQSPTPQPSASPQN